MIETAPDKDLRRQLGDLIKRERVRMELSHREVADRCGTSAAQVKEWEDGRSVPSGREWAREARQLAERGDMPAETR